MKRLALLIGILILTTVFLYGCGGGGQNDENASTAGGDTEDTVANGETEDVYGQLGFDLMEAESQYILQGGVTAAEMQALFGEPETTSDAEIWGADGLEHQTWSYPGQGLELDLVRQEDNVQIVDMVTLTAPSELKTSKDIGIGSSRADVEAVYKAEINPDAGDEATIVAGTVYGGVIFKLENDKVASIFIGAAAE